MLEMKISRYDQMGILMKKFAEKKAVPLTRIKFKFDGEVIRPEESAADLDLEGGECIDVFEI